jgi:hypothetical protein
LDPECHPFVHDRRPVGRDDNAHRAIRSAVNADVKDRRRPLRFDDLGAPDSVGCTG